MDPVSIVSLVGVATTLAEASFEIAKGLNEYRVQYKKASRTLGSIVSYCNTIHASIIIIRKWIQSTLAICPDKVLHVAPIQTSLDSFVESLSELDEEVRKLLGKDEDPLRVSRRKRLKYVWNEQIMKDHLRKIQVQITALHFLLAATSL
ncbi:hypothetical protein MMC17_002729 [Xylographa soralifera]|nr:hypothetical protein [Xylographa soralifera]